jgi:hypothetical protein
MAGEEVAVADLPTHACVCHGPPLGGAYDAPLKITSVMACL